MIGRASLALVGAALVLSAALRGAAGARGTADRVGLQPSRHGDAELFRRGAGAVRLGRKGRLHACDPHQLRSRGHRLGPARRHGDAAQGAQIRHLDQHRLPPVPAGADLSRACSPTGRSTPSPRPTSSGASSSASTMCCLTQRVGPDYADVVPNDAFRRAFVRLRSEHGLYREDTSAVTFLTPTLFRTGIPLPAEVPIGTYGVEIKTVLRRRAGDARPKPRSKSSRSASSSSSPPPPARTASSMASSPPSWR